MHDACTAQCRPAPASSGAASEARAQGKVRVPHVPALQHREEKRVLCRTALAWANPDTYERVEAAFGAAAHILRQAQPYFSMSSSAAAADVSSFSSKSSPNRCRMPSGGPRPINLRMPGLSQMERRMAKDGVRERAT